MPKLEPAPPVDSSPWYSDLANNAALIIGGSLASGLLGRVAYRYAGRQGMGYELVEGEAPEIKEMDNMADVGDPNADPAFQEPYLDDPDLTLSRRMRTGRGGPADVMPPLERGPPRGPPPPTYSNVLGLGENDTVTVDPRVNDVPRQKPLRHFTPFFGGKTQGVRESPKQDTKPKRFSNLPPLVEVDEKALTPEGRTQLYKETFKLKNNPQEGSAHYEIFERFVNREIGLEEARKRYNQVKREATQAGALKKLR